MAQYAQVELVEACRVIYPDRPQVDRGFLRTLDLPRLKSAYRRQALATHPDLFAQEPPQTRDHYARRFHEVNRSYRMLVEYVKTRPEEKPLFKAHAMPWKARRRASEKVRQKDFTAPPRASANLGGSSWKRSREARRSRPCWTPSGNGNVKAKASEGKMALRTLPPWKLRLGEFLFYSGQITWNQLIRVLVKQKNDRMRLGDLAVKWGWLSRKHLGQLLGQRRRGERVGDLMVRRRIITPFRLGMLVNHQKRHRKRIGRYFVECGILEGKDIAAALLRLNAHNRKNAYRRQESARGRQ